MKRWMSILVGGCLALSLSFALACKPAETPESKELAAIDAELKEINDKLAKLPDGSDEVQNLNDRKVELNAQRTNIMQKADRARQK